MNSNSSSSQKNSVSTKNNPGGTTNYFEPEGCPAVIDGRRCGETKNLQIIQEFKRLYETKMKQIDDAAGGDCVQAKINLQQEWIRDLTEQNEMLVRVVEELEVEAAERVMRLEEKLQHSAKCACEKMGHIQNDLNNLIEVLKRVKNYGLWSSRGLNFYTINIEELMNGTDGDLVQTEINRNTDCNCNCNGDTSAICKNERLLKEKDRKLKDLEEKIKKLNEIAEKNEEARRTCQQYAELKKSMLDMRDTLTAEVAEKHDTIVCLRREVHMLEEQCRKADQQTHFKDDIIKELRKEIKQLKLQKMDVEKENLQEKVRNLEADNNMLKDSIVKAKKNLEKLEEKAERYLEERDDIKSKHRESLEMIETLQKENMRSKESLKTLEEEQKTAMNKLQNKMMQELVEYEKKHRDSMQKLDTLRDELEKTKRENSSSMTKVKTLSDENRSQAEMIAELKDKMRKCAEKPATTSTGVVCKPNCRDTGIDACSPTTRSVGIDIAPDTRTVSTLSDIESQIIPTIVVEQYQPPLTRHQLRTVACETETNEVDQGKRPPNLETITTVNSYEEIEEEIVYTVDKPPILKKRDVPKALEDLQSEAMDAFALNHHKRDAFGFGGLQFTTDADDTRINELLQLEIADTAGLTSDASSSRNPYSELEVYKPVKDTRHLPNRTYNAKVLYNSNNIYQSSNESLRSSDVSDDILNQAFIDKPLKLVRIDPKPIETIGKNKDSSLSERDSDEISATYYMHKSNPEELRKTQTVELEGKKRYAPPQKPSAPEPKVTRNLLDVPRDGWSRAPKTADVRSRSVSPRRTNTSGSNPAEDLQNVVQDLNESVSRIIEKSPNEKATRQKIAKLEEQLRAALKQRERDVELERQKRNQEVENLKLTIREMEKVLQNKEVNASNLQSAVDLYLNSINVLEQSEERYKSEVAEQRLIISNLQEALVTTKQQLDDLKQKCQKDLESKCVLLDILDVGLCDLEKQCYHYYNQYLNSTATIEYLRDQILSLEVEKFDLIQEVLVMEARLLKYQEISKQYEGKYLGQECSEYCIKQDESVVTLAQDTISYTEDLQCQMAVLETALKREQKINMVQANRIEELQTIIGAKNLELTRANDAYQDVKAKLETATSKTKIFEDAIQELREQLKEMEMDNIHQEEKVDICHGELDICLNSLQSVKLRLRSQYKAMCQKIQDYTQLQADYRIQVNNVDMLKRDLENTRIRCRDEIIELKHNIRDLKEKLASSEDKIDTLNQELRKSQMLLSDAAHHESKIKQDFFAREKELTEKIHSAQEEEMRLLDLVTQLEQQTVDMKNEIDCRGVQLEAAKQTILQMNSDALMKQQMTQEEINKLKNEINTLLQQQGVQKADNERLQKQVECMKCQLNQTDKKGVQQQLDKCMNDLKNMEADKYFLEQRNAKLMEALDKMQVALQSRTESIATMEIELLEAKTSRDEICNESRNVVFNVRAWLEEQKRINEQLKDKLQKKNAVIAKYEQEKRRNQCNCTSRINYPRQRGGTLQANYFQNNPPPLSRSPWSLDSRGSGSESPTSSVSSTPADWCEYEEVGYDEATADEPSAAVWIHRVESMTEELQRSNRYWKRKINDSEFMVTKDK